MAQQIGSRSQREPFQLLTKVSFNVDGKTDGQLQVAFIQARPSWLLLDQGNGKQSIILDLLSFQSHLPDNKDQRLWNINRGFSILQNTKVSIGLLVVLKSKVLGQRRRLEKGGRDSLDEVMKPFIY